MEEVGSVGGFTWTAQETAAWLPLCHMTTKVGISSLALQQEKTDGIKPLLSRKKQAPLTPERERQAAQALPGRSPPG